MIFSGVNGIVTHIFEVEDTPALGIHRLYSGVGHPTYQNKVVHTRIIGRKVLSPVNGYVSHMETLPKGSKKWSFLSNFEFFNLKKYKDSGLRYSGVSFVIRDVQVVYIGEIDFLEVSEGEYRSEGDGLLQGKNGGHLFTSFPNSYILKVSKYSFVGKERVIAFER